MKAIIIVDIPDDFKKTYADITIYEDEPPYGVIERMEYLKPIPEYKDLYEEEPTMMFIKGSVVDSFACGWNACLDKILGDEHE